MFLGVLGALGVSLAGVRLYAVVAFSVSRRSREIGIRMALGAGSREVVWPIAREVGALITAGTVVGLLLGSVPIPLMRAFSEPAPGIAIYRPTFDPVTLVSIATFMIVVGIAAAYFPRVAQPGPTR